MERTVVLLASFFFVLQAHAQSTGAAQQVQLLAPQLVAFSGSAANFQNLANGLVAGTPITITGVTPDGLQQTVTITPTAAMSATQAAQTLESARQLLIARGIAQPTAQQIGIALTGGALPTALGVTQIPGTLTGTINTAALQVQQQPAAVAPFGGSAGNFQNLNAGLQGGGTVALNASNGQVVTFAVPGGAMSAAQASQTMQLASQLLFAQGITNPTPDQIRAALLGGPIVTGLGSTVQLRGVLEGRGSVASPTFTTTNPTFTSSTPTFTGPNPTFTTSNPTFTTTNPTFSSGTPGFPQASVGASSPPATTPNGAPSPAAQMQQRR